MQYKQAKLSKHTISLLSDHSLDVDDVLLTIALGNLTLSVGEVSSDNHDLIIHSNWKRSNVVLLSELLGERSRHSDASLAGRSIEMSLSLLSCLRADVWIEFHLENNLKEPML